MSFYEDIARKLSEQQIIPKEDEEIYSYGLWQGVLFILNLATVVALGLLFKMVWQSLFFTICYGSVRIFAGGYHTRTPLRCYIFSAVMMASVLWCLKTLSFSVPMVLTALIFSFFAIFFLSPVEDENKPLDQKEFSVYRNRARFLLFLWTGVCLLAWRLKLLQVFNCIVVSLFTLSLMLVLGKTRNILRCRMS